MRKPATILLAAMLLVSLTGVAYPAEPVPTAAGSGPARPFTVAFPRPAGLPSSARLVDPSAGLPDGYVYVVNLWSRKCLDAFYSDDGGNGNRVGLWDCNGGVTERWFLGYSHRSDVYDRTLINDRNGRVLDYPEVSDGKVGWQFQLWDSYLGSEGQSLWFYYRNDDVGGWEISVARGGGAEVMDAYTSDGGVNGNRVGLWWITGHPAQRWVLYQSV